MVRRLFLLALCGLTLVSVSSAGLAATITDWQLILNVVPGSTDVANAAPHVVIGTASDASDAYVGPEDIAYPPGIPDPFAKAVYLRIQRPANQTGTSAYYMQDIRAPVKPFNPKTWTLILSTSSFNSTMSNPDVSITWDPASLPPNMDLTLVEDGGDYNADGFTSYNMKAVTSYTVRQDQNDQRKLRIVATNTTPTVQITSPPSVTDLGYDHITISWTTDVDSTSRVDYGPTTAYGANVEDDTPAKNHVVTIKGLSPNTDYHLQASSAAPPRDPGVSDDLVVHTLLRPVQITDLAVVNVQSHQVTITWHTDIPTVSRVEYGETTSYGQTVSGTETTTDQAITLTNLKAGTTYYYRVTSEDPGNALGMVAGQTFKTLDAIAITNGPTASPTASDATITWQTNVPTIGKVDWGVDASYGGGSVADQTPTQTHSLVITGLAANATYHYRVTNTAAGRDTLTSGDLTFTTSQALVVITMPPAETELTATSVTITWSTDVAADSKVKYGTTTDYGNEVGSTALVTQHVVKLSSLTPGTTYHYKVVSSAPGRSPVESGDRSFATPQALTITAGPSYTVTATTATVVWSTSLPSNSLVEYGTAGKFDQQAKSDDLVADHVIVLSNLQPATTYSYRVTSTGPGLDVARSVAFTLTTKPRVNVTAGPTVKDITSTGATITLTTDTFSEVQVQYGLDATYGSSASSDKVGTQHTVQLTGLTPGATYHYQVIATSPGLESYVSPDATFQTLLPTVTITSGPTVTNVTPDGVTIVWETDVDADSQVEYGDTPGYGQTAKDSVGKQHSVRIGGLQPATTYHFRVVSAATGYQTAASNDATFKTGDPLVRIIEGPAVQATSFSATVTWKTDVQADSKVEYGPNDQYGQVVTDSNAVTDHAVTLPNLAPDTQYHFRVTSAASGRLPAVSADQTFATPKAVMTFVSAPAASAITGNTATISWSTSVAASAKVEYGTTTSYGSQVAVADQRASQQVVLTGLLPSTTYHVRVTATATGFADLVSADVTFTTGSSGIHYTFLRGFNVLDMANDNTGAILDQTSDLFAATVGNERDIAYDAKRQILYIARGNLTTGDGRANGTRGVAAIKLQPIASSANPNTPGATSNFTDTGLITAPVDATGKTGLGFIQSLYFDPDTDALYVLSGEPEGGPSSAPRVYAAPGGTVGGAPDGGDTSAQNAALRLLFAVTDDAGTNGSAMGGSNRGLCVQTRQGVTWVYMAMGQHADVWNNAGGTWHRAWASALFPKDNVATDKLDPAGNYVQAVTVDDLGNSYWAVHYTNPARIWCFPATATGTGLEFNDTAYGGRSTGPGVPLIIQNDGTAIPPANVNSPANVEFVKEGDNRYLFVSLLGANTSSRSVARVKLMGLPDGTAPSVTGRIIDGFGPGASGVPQDPVLATLTTKQKRAADGTKLTQPDVVGTDVSYLLYATAPEPGKLWLNGFVRDPNKGQAIPTATAMELAMSPARDRVFFTQPPQVVRIGPDSVTIQWTTEQETSLNTLEFGTDTSYGQKATSKGGLVHQFTLNGLKTGQTYHFRVTSELEGLDSATSPDLTFVPRTPVKLGDVNGDGAVRVNDVQIALKIALQLTQPTPDQIQAADVYPIGAPDGKVTLSDVTVILKAALGLITL